MWKSKSSPYFTPTKPVCKFIWTNSATSTELCSDIFPLHSGKKVSMRRRTRKNNECEEPKCDAEHSFDDKYPCPTRTTANTIHSDNGIGQETRKGTGQWACGQNDWDPERPALKKIPSKGQVSHEPRLQLLTAIPERKISDDTWKDATCQNSLMRRRFSDNEGACLQRHRGKNGKRVDRNDFLLSLSERIQCHARDGANIAYLATWPLPPKGWA